VADIHVAVLFGIKLYPLERTHTLALYHSYSLTTTHPLSLRTQKHGPGEARGGGDTHARGENSWDFPRIWKKIMGPLRILQVGKKLRGKGFSKTFIATKIFRPSAAERQTWIPRIANLAY
jgi:hypothetical protein